jgi:hypothetical protein
MTIGGVLSEALGLYRRFFKRFFLTAAAVFVVIDLLSAIADDVSKDGSDGVTAFWALISVTGSLIGLLWVQGALTATVADVRDGRADEDIETTYRRVRPVLLTLLVAGLLAGLGIFFGLLLLIVPGLFLLARWSVVTPVVVLERTRAIDALRGSWELVKGRTWTAFGIVVITLLGSLALQLIGYAAFIFLPEFFRTWIGGLVAHSIATPFVAAAWTVMYFHLRAPEPTREPVPEAA